MHHSGTSGKSWGRDSNPQEDCPGLTERGHGTQGSTMTPKPLIETRTDRQTHSHTLVHTHTHHTCMCRGLTAFNYGLLMNECIHTYRKYKISSKFRITWNGLWLLIMLLYTDAVNTSVSVLHCPVLEDSDGTKKLVRVHTSICTAMHAHILLEFCIYNFEH